MSVYTEQRQRLLKERIARRKATSAPMPPASCIYHVKNEPMILNGLVSSAASEAVNCSIALPPANGFVFEDMFVYVNEKGQTVITSKRANKIVRSLQKGMTAAATTTTTTKAATMVSRSLSLLKRSAIVATGIVGIVGPAMIYFA